MTNSNYSSALSETAHLNVGSGVKFLLIGGAIGAAVAMLFTPRSGRQIRRSIADASRAGYDRTLEKALTLREMSEDAIEQFTKKGGEAADPVSTNEKSTNHVECVRTKHASSGRRPASIF